MSPNYAVMSEKIEGMFLNYYGTTLIEGYQAIKHLSDEICYFAEELPRQLIKFDIRCRIYFRRRFPNNKTRTRKLQSKFLKYKKEDKMYGAKKK